MAAIINSPDYLIIGSQTSNSFGLYVDTPPKRPMAAQNTQVINIPGREETLYETFDKYEDVVMNIKAFSFENDFEISPVYAWLRTAKTFSFNSDSEHCYRVKKLNGIQPNYSGHGKNVYTISFVVSPFLYFTNNHPVTKTSDQFVITNNGNHYCKPTIKVYGNGNISLTVVNSEASGFPSEPDMTIPNVNGYCIIDAERTLVYKDNEFVKFEGKIPFADVGDNGYWFRGGGYTKCEVIMNARDV